jgi:hypothetical protein
VDGGRGVYLCGLTFCARSIFFIHQEACSVLRAPRRPIGWRSLDYRLGQAQDLEAWAQHSAVQDETSQKKNFPRPTTTDWVEAEVTPT